MLPKFPFFDPGPESALISPQTPAQFIISPRALKFIRAAASLSGSECLTLKQASPEKVEKARPGGPVLLAWPGEQAEGKRLACQPEA